VALGLVVAGSGCGSTVPGGNAATVAAGSSNAQAPGAEQSGPPAASGAPGASGSAAPSAAAPGDAQAAPVCGTSTLTGALEDVEGAAGQVYGRLVLTNTGAAACRLDGFPDVRFVDTGGTELGAAASHDDSSPVPGPALLPPGGTAASVLRITQPGIQQGCLDAELTREASGLRVTPPGSTGTLPVELAGVTACTSVDVKQLQVGPMTTS